MEILGVLDTEELAVLSGGPYFVKADQVELSADVDPLWTDAEDADPFKAALGVDDACRQGSRQRRRHSDGDDVQGLDDDGLGRHLWTGIKRGIITFTLLFIFIYRYMEFFRGAFVMLYCHVI